MPRQTGRPFCRPFARAGCFRPWMGSRNSARSKRGRRAVRILRASVSTSIGMDRSPCKRESRARQNDVGRLAQRGSPVRNARRHTAARYWRGGRCLPLRSVPSRTRSPQRCPVAAQQSHLRRTARCSSTVSTEVLLAPASERAPWRRWTGEPRRALSRRARSTWGRWRTARRRSNGASAWRLVSGAASSPRCRFPVDRGRLAQFDRVQLRVMSDGPRRIWAQLRTDEPGQRWGRTFYLDHP